VATGFAALAVLPAAALARAIPGASYLGTTSQGGTIELTVSNDGKSIASYYYFGIYGTYATPGLDCSIQSSGSAGFWIGAPIVKNVFSYAIGGPNLWQGTFGPGQTVSGTLRVYIPASTTTGSPPLGPCDTGTLPWTATTKAQPPSGGTGSGGGGPSGGQTRPMFATSVTLHKRAHRELAGRIGSSSPLCRAHRTVVLWIGHKRAGSSHSNARGAFAFGTPKRHQRVHVSVAAKTLTVGICAAGTSHLIKA
jgi:hypothetical protein